MQGVRESPGLSVADALSWAVSHAEGRVTQAIGIALTTPIYEFATHRLPTGDNRH